jgi:hypothetical protein
VKKTIDEKKRAALAAQDQINRAYRLVFGVDGARSPQQIAVWNDLRRVCRTEKTTAVFDVAGRIDPAASQMNEGKRLVFLGINAKVNQQPRITDE